MAMNDTGAMRRAVTAFFDERSQAQAAIDDLLAAGVARGRITLLEGGPGQKLDGVEPSSEKGFLAAVRELFMADEDHHAYEGLRRGGFLLSVETGAGDHARVVEVLDREGAVDMDARQSDWELEGWDPARASADLRAASLAEVQAAVEPVGAVGPAFAREPRAAAAPPDVAGLSEGEVRTAVEPAGAVGPAFGRAEAPTADGPAIPGADVRAAVEPVGAVGPAFGSGRGPAPRPAPRAIVRDTEAEGLRLRTYVESHDRPDAMR